jgi:flagellar basal body-associated protein FliL
MIYIYIGIVLLIAAIPVYAALCMSGQQSREEERRDGTEG